ncbi:MAG: FAD-dependent oxidoreductase [Clostridia bacterium]|nr:FAD-dependent oxidoreductase [Clostridia bacterium]
MRRLLSLFLALTLVLGAASFAAAEETVVTGQAQGFADVVKVTITLTDGRITAVDFESNESSPAIGNDLSSLAEQVIAAQGAEIDGVTGATVTSNAVREAVAAALASTEPAAEEKAAMTFTPGTYVGTGTGYNGASTFKVTFSETAIKAIEVEKSTETAHVGDIAFAPMIEDMIAANGSGVDGVSGATFSARALRTAVNDAAEQAGCTDMAAFKAARVEHAAGEPIELTYDVVIVGAGGAGIAAAAQAAQNGYTVLILEKNAEVGGNTLVSGGQYQSVMPYLVWDPANPDAAEGVYAFTGTAYPKVKSVQGCINELRMILNWSEEPFDTEYYKDHEFVAGDAAELSKHGVHAEYLPVLKALKEEIRAYLDWAEPQLEAGVAENQLALFSTLNLHIFQTYYGGLRPSADGSEWMYGDVDLVSQFIQGGQGLKEWLEEQGSAFKEDSQPTLIGALWYRENEYAGANVDTDGDGETEFYADRWGSYFMAPMTTVLKANEANQIMLRTEAKSLIVEDGRVTGVLAEKFDGTQVTVHAAKGVVLATGGYAANIPLVLENNVYWSSEYLTPSTKTTNRSSLMGSGIAMAREVGADVTGMGFTQLMPISWVDNGNLAFGGGNYACWINPMTGDRFVDEGSERDVLSLAEFRNGMVVNGTPGVFLEIYNATERIPGPPSAQLAAEDYPGRYYHIKGTVEELTALFEKIGGIEADPQHVLDTVRAYDMAVMGQGEYPNVGKAIASRCVGNVQQDENGNYLPETYDLKGTDLIVRLMAPSTHHTMGGLKVDTQRHVLNRDGEIIPGLYAAGEVTGGIHGGNRLGGNAIVEIFVSGRTAANAIQADDTGAETPAE